MEPGRRPAGDELDEDRSVRHCLFEEGDLSSSYHGRRPSCAAPPAVSSALSPRPLFVVLAREVAWLREDLEATRASLDTIEVEAGIIRAQLVDADGWWRVCSSRPRSPVLFRSLGFVRSFSSLVSSGLELDTTPRPFASA